MVLATTASEAELNEVFDRAVALHTQDRTDEALGLYVDLLGFRRTSDFFRKQLMWPVLNNLIMLLHFGGHQQAALSAYREAITESGRKYPEEFETLYCRAMEITNTAPVPFKRAHRIYNLLALLKSTAAVAGDVVECGCYQGLSSYMLCSQLRLLDAAFDGTGFHIFDSFEGLSNPVAEDWVSDDHPDAGRVQSMCRPGNFAATLASVQAAMADFPGVAFHPGWIPDRFPEMPERQYRFIHVDVDLYQPTRDALDYFFPRLSPGGMIVSDDYNWPGARKAIDEFATERPVKLTVNEWQQAVLTHM